MEYSEPSQNVNNFPDVTLPPPPEKIKGRISKDPDVLWCIIDESAKYAKKREWLLPLYAAVELTNRNFKFGPRTFITLEEYAQSKGYLTFFMMLNDISRQIDDNPELTQQGTDRDLSVTTYAIRKTPLVFNVIALLLSSSLFYLAIGWNIEPEIRLLFFILVLVLIVNSILLIRGLMLVKKEASEETPRIMKSFQKKLTVRLPQFFLLFSFSTIWAYFIAEQFSYTYLLRGQPTTKKNFDAAIQRRYLDAEIIYDFNFIAAGIALMIMTLLLLSLYKAVKPMIKALLKAHK